jgi:type III secretion system FlhB-like substrate exporter
MKRAVALQYDVDVAEQYAAPVVVSSGQGDLADRIERAARAYGVPIVRDLPLAQALSDLADGEPIPEALYEPVAAILCALAEAGSE